MNDRQDEPSVVGPSEPQIVAAKQHSAHEHRALLAHRGKLVRAYGDNAADLATAFAAADLRRIEVEAQLEALQRVIEKVRSYSKPVRMVVEMAEAATSPDRACTCKLTSLDPHVELAVDPECPAHSTSPDRGDLDIFTAGPGTPEEYGPDNGRTSDSSDQQSREET